MNPRKNRHLHYNWRRIPFLGARYYLVAIGLVTVGRILWWLLRVVVIVALVMVIALSTGFTFHYVYQLLFGG